MATDVVMPQMGESIAEGTIVRWIKKPGDKVERDEPLLEISTDKVDAEIPAPASGTLTEILAQEGQTVGVNSVIARIDGGGESRKPEPEPEPQPEPEKPQPAAAPKPVTPAPPPARQPQNFATAPEKPGSGSGSGSGSVAPVTDLDERRRTKSSPLVRKIARENNVDIAQIEGTGVSGRVTKNDILGYLQKPAGEQPSAPPRQAEEVRIEPLSVMRKKIAQHMVLSKQTSAHVTTVFEVDFTAIERLRQQYKDVYAERGAKLTYLPFIVQAIVAGLREFPILNASMDENSILYHRDYNIGIAVALDWGLIVPVVKRADEKNLLGLSKTIADLGNRARSKKLSPDEVSGGTFTITNPGIFGGLFGTPIINQPQVAILGVGGVKKRPVVVETDDGDFIAIRSMCILSLTFDHRLIDGAVADQFMAFVKGVIEEGNFAM
ncbi:MAG TPA: dihydrolipoamide acetyltransferase family protein [Thermoanaerobaculia bacterium]|nr:dihydrolipoamide acetyltransferase family protein [Thermoanaerobaculia bacterium]